MRSSNDHKPSLTMKVILLMEDVNEANSSEEAKYISTPPCRKVNHTIIQVVSFGENEMPTELNRIIEVQDMIDQMQERADIRFECMDEL